MEFQIITQNHDIKDMFDQEFLLWAKSIIIYCQRTQKSSSAIQYLIKDLHVETCTVSDFSILMFCVAHCGIGDSDFQLKGIRCLIHNTTKRPKAAVTGNSQPQLVIIEGDHDQYSVAVEQQHLLESRELPTAVFLLLATHYIFNLSYHPKAEDLLHFIQEKMALMSSATRITSSYGPHKWDIPSVPINKRTCHRK